MLNIQDKIKSLPDTREEVDWKNRVSISLPDIKGSDELVTLFSKADVKQWLEDFKTYYKESPKFKEENGHLILTNPTYLKNKQEYITGKQDFLKNIKETKMKKSEFKQKIKEQILSSLTEKKKKEEKTPEMELDAETEATPDPSPESDFGVDPKITTIQNALKAAYDGAKEMGDEKLSTQVGNTITYFTRAHVVKDQGNVAENLKKIVKEVIKQKINK